MKMTAGIKRERRAGYAFVSLWIIGFIVFKAYPLIYSLFLSFNKITITASEGIKANWIQWENYRSAFLSDTSFYPKLINYVKNTVVTVPIMVVLAVILALILNMKIKGRGIFRTIFFIPVIIVSGPVIKELQEQNLLLLPGLQQGDILKYIELSLPSIVASPIIYLLNNVVTLLWFSGVQILIMLSGLQKIDVQIYEAALIDGASPWEIFWKITLPVLKPLILVNIVYTTVTISTFSLNEILVYIKKAMFDLSTGFGYASALAWIYFVIITLLLMLFVLVTRLHKE